MSDKLDALRALLVKINEGGDAIEYYFLPEVRAWRSPLEYLEIERWVSYAYDGSLDAAMSLHKAVLPGWEVNQIGEAKNKLGPWFCVLVNPDWSGLQGADVARSTTPARAWLIAIIRALIAIEEGKA